MTGKQIIALRKRGGQTQQEFATMINATVSTVSGWERGIHTPSRIYKKALEVLAKNQK